MLRVDEAAVLATFTRLHERELVKVGLSSAGVLTWAMSWLQSRPNPCGWSARTAKSAIWKKWSPATSRRWGGGSACLSGARPGDRRDAAALTLCPSKRATPGRRNYSLNGRNVSKRSPKSAPYIATARKEGYLDDANNV